jgi:aspartyl-tRNA(Asn)/glutamyl-tRNA(Gln) amidotransferase subunit C
LRIDREEVLRIARLAHLELGPDEVARFTEQLDTILNYMDKLRGLNTEGVEPTYHALQDLANVFRQDKVGGVLPVEKALANAPEREGSFIKVPRIVEERG